MAHERTTSSNWRSVMRATLWLCLTVTAATAAVMTAVSPTGLQRLSLAGEPSSALPGERGFAVSGNTPVRRLDIIQVTQLEQRLEQLSESIGALQRQTLAQAQEQNAVLTKLSAMEESFGLITGSLPGPQDDPVSAPQAARITLPQGKSGIEVRYQALSAKQDEAAHNSSAHMTRPDNPAVPQRSPGPVPNQVPNQVNDGVTAALSAHSAPHDRPPLPPVLPGNVIPQAGKQSETEPRVLKTHFAIELVSAQDMARIEQVWAWARDAGGKSVTALEPRLRLDRLPDGGAVLALIAGPIDNAQDAARLCAALKDVAPRCKTVPFAGRTIAFQ